MSLTSFALAAGFFTTSTTWEALSLNYQNIQKYILVTKSVSVFTAIYSGLPEGKVLSSKILPCDPHPQFFPPSSTPLPCFLCSLYITVQHGGQIQRHDLTNPEGDGFLGRSNAQFRLNLSHSAMLHCLIGTDRKQSEGFPTSYHCLLILLLTIISHQNHTQS